MHDILVLVINCNINKVSYYAVFPQILISIINIRMLWELLVKNLVAKA